MGKKNKQRASTSPSTPTPPPSSAPTAPPSPTAPPTPAAPPPSTSDAGPPPISSAPLPLLDLSAGDLGAFFELCFPDKRLIELCRELKLHTPGYRLEALPPDQVARVLADEYLAAKDVRPHLEGAVRETIRDPILEGREVSAADLGQLLDLVVAGDPLQHLARIAWRKLRGADEAREAAEHRVAQLERRLAQAPQPVALPQPSGDADLPSEEEASTFLVPVLTREFYDSIERWDRRMQRAAFDKIHRLANDWRHGSLRALALEGVPGYYRIRVATDVRLIYRRDGNRLEVLSLIDREDLDRYVRQARTRPA